MNWNAPRFSRIYRLSTKCTDSHRNISVQYQGTSKTVPTKLIGGSGIQESPVPNLAWIPSRPGLPKIESRATPFRNYARISMLSASTHQLTSSILRRRISRSCARSSKELKLDASAKRYSSYPLIRRYAAITLPDDIPFCNLCHLLFNPRYWSYFGLMMLDISSLPLGPSLSWHVGYDFQFM